MLLQLQDVTASYGAVQALYGVDLSLERGEVLALMGRNGMGKSTTIKVICRLLSHQNGSVIFNGNNLTPLASHQAAKLGIGLCPEGRRVFTNLTVIENLKVSAKPGEWDFHKVTSLFPRLRERQHQMAGSLSGGEQQMLAIGRALMTNPKLLVLDEATEGLAPVVRQEIWASIVQLKQAGDLALLIVDKTLVELARVADHAVILERGKTVWAGRFEALKSEQANAFLGV